MDANAGTVSRSFRISAEEIAAIDDWVEQAVKHWAESAVVIFRARLCVAELAANVLEHGFSRSQRDRVEVTLRHHDGVEIEFLDTCGPFDPTSETSASQVVSLQSLREGGWGLKLLRAYGQDLCYAREAGRNRITLKVRAD